MKTNKINVVLSLNKTTVSSLTEEMEKIGQASVGFCKSSLDCLSNPASCYTYRAPCGDAVAKTTAVFFTHTCLNC